jgi:hypothetical protein
MEGRLKTDSSRHTGEKLPDEVKTEVLAYLKEGNGIVATANKFKLTTHTVTALRNKAEEDDPSFNLAAWKKQTAATLSHFAAKGSKRLVDEVDKMPLASLPIAIAVAIDKIQALHDQPQTVVEHRLRVDHQAVNSLFDANNIVLDAELVETDEA